MLARLIVALGLALVGAHAAAQVPGGKVELVWLGQSAFKITSPGGKVIVTDPWLRTNPLTPAEYKKPESFGRVDVLLVSHGHFDHIADAPDIAKMYGVPLRAPGDLNNTLMTLGVLPAALLPRMNKGGTVTPAPGIKVTAVHAEHSSIYVSRNGERDETHPGGEPVGWIIELENGPADAAWAVKELIRPKVVIPMHYGTNPLAKGTAKGFVDAMGDSPVKVIVATPGVALSF